MNDAQRAAVEHGDGPLLVLAGAGTGKTATLANRVGRLLADGADPERVCLLTFSRRAAQEMLTRAGRIADPRATQRVWGGTFHAVAHRLLRHPSDPEFRHPVTVDFCESCGLIQLHDPIPAHELYKSYYLTSHKPQPHFRRFASPKFLN